MMQTEKSVTGAVRGTDLKSRRYDLIPSLAVPYILGTPMTGEVPFDVLPIVQLYAWINNEERYDIESVIRSVVRLMGSPLEAMDRLAATCYEGAVKYGEWNWRKGFPISDLLNHALRHLLCYHQRETVVTDEDDLAHALWNLCVVYEFLERRPELMDIGPRKPPTAVGIDASTGKPVVQNIDGQYSYNAETGAR